MKEAIYRSGEPLRHPKSSATAMSLDEILALVNLSLRLRRLNAPVRRLALVRDGGTSSYAADRAPLFAVWRSIRR